MGTQVSSLFIDGEFVASATGDTFETRNPSDGSLIATVARASAEDVDRAVGAARRAFDEGPWPAMSPRERSRILVRMGELLAERQADLSELEARDAGHTLRMANLFTIPLALYHWQYLAEAAQRIDLTQQVPRTDFPAPAWEFVQREPYGVCAGVIPWNFPFIMAVWKAAPALATGNTMVLKPSPYTPLTALWATYLHSGQICHSGTRCLVPAALYDEVTARMVELAEGLKVGDAMDFESDLGPVVDRRQLETIGRYIQIGQDEGAKLLTGGGHPDGVPEGGFYVEPTIFGDVDNSMKIAQE